MAPDLAALSDHVKSSLAADKASCELVLVGTIGHAANGKVDHERPTVVVGERTASR